MVSFNPAESGATLDVVENFEFVEFVDVAVKGEDAFLAVGSELTHHPVAVDRTATDVDGLFGDGGRGAVIIDVFI